MKAAPIIVLGGIIGAIVLSARKPKRTRAPTITLEDPTVDELVPAPAEGVVVMSGVQEEAPNLGGAHVDWWIAVHEGGFGWQYVLTDGSSQMSYREGVIYYFPSTELALDDLRKVLG